MRAVTVRNLPERPDAWHPGDSMVRDTTPSPAAWLQGIALALLLSACASAGTIDVTGLSLPVSFTPGDFGYQSDPDVPPADLFDDLAAVSATAPGADAPGFTLEASGVVPLDAALDLDFDTTLVLEDGVD